MMEGIARRKVRAAERTLESQRRGVRFLASNTARNMPPTMLYTVESTATPMDSSSEVNVMSNWLISILASFPMASGMRETPSRN